MAKGCGMLNARIRPGEGVNDNADDSHGESRQEGKPGVHRPEPPPENRGGKNGEAAYKIIYSHRSSPKRFMREIDNESFPRGFAEFPQAADNERHDHPSDTAGKDQREGKK